MNFLGNLTKLCVFFAKLTVLNCNSRFVDSETNRVKDILKEMENFSPIGSSILNRSGASF